MMPWQKKKKGRKATGSGGSSSAVPLLLLQSITPRKSTRSWHSEGERPGGRLNRVSEMMIDNNNYSYKLLLVVIVK